MIRESIIEKESNFIDTLWSMTDEDTMSVTTEVECNLAEIQKVNFLKTQEP